VLKVFLFTLLISQSLFANNYYRTSFAVVDKSNLLMWQDNKDVVELMFTHKEAVKYCDELTLGGFENWRLPDIKELELIVDKKNSPYYIQRVFRNKLASGYWASNKLLRTFNFYAWYMNFLSGTPYYYNRVYHKYVRCVRDIE
jgi:hypothetical protein